MDRELKQPGRMLVKSIGFEVTVPAGTYYLGDPCYAVPDGDWSALLDSCQTFDLPVGEVRGHQVLGFGTKYGDGVYKDQEGHEYWVDAGLIGLVPEAVFTVCTAQDCGHPASEHTADGCMHALPREDWAETPEDPTVFCSCTVPGGVPAVAFKYPVSQMSEMGRFVTFDHDVTAVMDSTGLLVFGRYKIDTGDTDEEEDDFYAGERGDNGGWL